MLSDNIKNIRKNKGFTQEDLANRIHVSRQTISKWEKGHSVPDADMLSRLADELEVSVGDLLGDSEIPEQEKDSLSEQLARINEQLSIKNRRSKRIWKTVLILAIIIFGVIPGFAMLGSVYYRSNLESGDTGFAGRVEYTCTLDGEKYVYSIEYDDQYRVVSTEGDDFIENRINVEDYDDAHKAAAAIEDYFSDHGGTAEQTEIKGLGLD